MNKNKQNKTELKNRYLHFCFRLPRAKTEKHQPVYRPLLPSLKHPTFFHQILLVYFLQHTCLPACLPAWCLQEKFDFRFNILKMFNLKSNLSRKQMSIITPTSVLDSDLEIMRGPCHPDPEIRGWGRGGSLQNFFWALWASVWSKNGGGGAGPPGPLPQVRH